MLVINDLINLTIYIKNIYIHRREIDVETHETTWNIRFLLQFWNIQTVSKKLV